MNKGRSRFTPAFSLSTDALESRIVLSGNAAASALHQGAVEIAARTAGEARTQTSLAISAGTLGQPITFTVTVRARRRAQAHRKGR